ncbi:MAG: valine--tRNA ligase [Candidatus Shapirobacteria bacterium]|nr:valine--tRNA ligase [Candidatus Shapirobacteria bacterium]
MEKNYEPQKTENKIYQFWEKGNYFQPIFDKKKKSQKPFVITLPPPNVTGELHLGHALYCLEDLMIRYHRMLGEPTLWLPGFDHASIAVEYLVNKQLKKEGTNKQYIGREEFLKRAKDFADKSKSHIKNQLISLGFSLDWTHEAYTMDEKRSLAVKEAFKRLYEKGLIYQGERIINWCSKCQTALSDLENDYQEEKGILYYIKYGSITIATTRPETMFADVAVAVNPKDKRYSKLIGKKVSLPLTNRKIPIISDESVDLKFGTGALKITPGHDPLDFEIGQKHKLEILIVINTKGHLTSLAGDYQNLTVNEAREKVVAELKKQGLLEKTQEFQHAVGHCQRCGTITEPLISKQWFVKTKTLAKPAIEAIKKGNIKIIPKKFEKVYLNWMENIRDWCISRQLWWGHQIPIEDETDVLDTWFSSGLWPFATLGWPEKTKDLENFYPTTVRETAYDILFFWVAREIMMSLFLTGKIPYEIVYLHGLVRDKQGQKMSKTKGNGLDPLELTQKYGTDALRMALIVGNAPGNDFSLTEDKVKAYRNFANKIWNASRFILSYEQQNIVSREAGSRSAGQRTKSIGKHKDDIWILEETEKVIKKVTSFINRYRFDLAAETIYHFFWHTFCDQYLEISKKRRDETQLTLIQVLETSLKLLHPFMPFLTEEIWCRMKNISVEHSRDKASGQKPLIITSWPK